MSQKSFVIVTILALLGCFGALEILLNFIMSPISRYNHAYIDTIQGLSLESFLEISGSIATLSILKSSSAGFSFIFNLNVQYGNMIQPLLMLLEKAWYASLVSLSVIEFIKLILDYSYRIFPLITLSFLLSYMLEIVLVDTKLKVHIQKVKQLCLCLSVITCLAIPVYISTLGVISQHLNVSLKLSIQEKLEDLHNNLPKKNSKSLKNSSKNYVENSVESYEKMSLKLRTLSSSIIQHIMAEIISAILVPVLFLFYIFYIFKYGVFLPWKKINSNN